MATSLQSLHPSAETPVSLHLSLGRLFLHLLNGWQGRSSGYRSLMTLSDHLLKDVGLSREVAESMHRKLL
jgi:uncharacterized protein YjiS (DUF1127 family)